MAESARYQIPSDVSQLTSRRVSFRRSISDETLPPEFLEALEQKRRQLDESIHKYISSKEREFKNYERELRTRAQSSAVSNSPVTPLDTALETNHHEHGEDGKQQRSGSQNGDSSSRRRSSSESTVHCWDDLDNPPTGKDGQPLTAIQALLLNGASTRRESNAIDDAPISAEARAAITGLVDRRASTERDKEFAGLFTPNFIKAIDDKSLRILEERSSPAPLLGSPDLNGARQEKSVDEPGRALPDTAAVELEGVRNRRPSQLQLTSRTSSSGSSADGRLASALKSPTQKDGAKRKRVSLAVGNSIVAPSDSVPSSATIVSNAPSHSRTRSNSATTTTITERGVPPFPSPLHQTSAVSPSPTSPQNNVFATDVTSEQSPAAQSLSHTMSSPEQIQKIATHSPQEPKSISEVPSSAPSRPEVDPDGDFFDLEEDADGGLFDPRHIGHDDDESSLTGDEESETDITGRVTSEDLEGLTSTSVKTQAVPSTPERRFNYDASSGLIPETDVITEPVEVMEEKGAVVVDLPPGSAISSQQPTRPGFRRPSVHRDPIFAGSPAEYASAESKAVEEDVYGSRYVQPGTKTSSFRGGSVGESFMERNAAELMRLRNVSGGQSTPRATDEVRT